jgi:hypothetical protein
MTPRIHGPFWPYNKRGLPIAMKNGIPAWLAVQEQRQQQEKKDER